MSMDPTPEAIRDEAARRGLVTPGDVAAEMARRGLAGEAPKKITDRFVDRPIGAGPLTAADLAEITGGTIGAAVGSPLGVPGIAVGGVLGVMGARAVSNFARGFEDYIRTQSGQELPADTLLGRPVENIKSIIGAGSQEAAMQTVIAAVPGSINVALRTVGHMAGATADDVTRALWEQTGARLGAVDLKKPFVEAAARVAGVMPIVGGPIRTSREIKAVDISTSFGRFLDDIAPPTDVIGLSNRISNAQIATIGAMRQNVSGLYEEAFRYFDAIGNPAVIPTAPIRQRLADLVEGINQLPVDTQGRPIGFELVRDERFAETLQRFMELPEFVTPTEIRAMQANLNRALQERSGVNELRNEFRIVSELGAGVREALQNIAPAMLPPDQAEQIVTRLRLANTAHGEVEQIVSTAASQVTRRVNRNALTAGFARPGSVEADELAELYLASGSLLRSPAFIQNFETLAGESNRRSLARLVLLKAAAPEMGIARAMPGPEGAGARAGGTSEIIVFDADRMLRQLGLSGADEFVGSGNIKQNREALERLLAGTGVTVAGLENFLRTTAKIQQSPVGDPSTFLTRKVILSGTPKALLPRVGEATAVGAAGTATMGMVSFGTFVFSARQFAKLISTPKGLALLREGMSVNLPTRQAVALGGRIREYVGDDEE